MRIAMVTFNWLSTIGGVTRYVDTLTRGLRDAPALDVTVVAPDAKAQVPVSGRRFGLAWATYRALRSIAPDVVHCHDNPWLGIGCIAYRIAHPRRCRIVFSAHTLYSANEDVAPRTRGAQLRVRVRAIAFRLFLRRWDRVTAVSAALGHSLRPGGVEVVPFGVECREPDPSEMADVRARYGLKGAGPVVVSVGVFYHEWKVEGFETLMSALAELQDEFPSLRLLIVGDGQWRERLRRHATTAGVERIVTFTGYLPDAAPVLAICDVYAHLATHEALGFAVAEAMALGKPVVGANRGGIPELVRHEETGLLVGPDPAAARDALSRMMRHPDRARAMGLRGRERIRNGYGWAAVTGRFRSIYAELASAMPEPPTARLRGSLR